LEANHSLNLETGARQNASTSSNYADQLNEIQDAKDGLKTPKRTRFKEMEEIIDIRDPAIDTLPMSLPKRAKLSKLRDVVKNENSETTKILLIAQIVEQWDEILVQIEDIQTNYNHNVNLEQKFREKMVESNLLIQSEIGKSEDMSRLLQNEIGAADVIFDGMSVWESLNKILNSSTKFHKIV